MVCFSAPGPHQIHDGGAVAATKPGGGRVAGESARISPVTTSMAKSATPNLKNRSPGPSPKRGGEHGHRPSPHASGGEGMGVRGVDQLITSPSDGSSDTPASWVVAAGFSSALRG